MSPSVMNMDNDGKMYPPNFLYTPMPSAESASYVDDIGAAASKRLAYFAPPNPGASGHCPMTFRLSTSKMRLAADAPEMAEDDSAS